MYYMLQLEKRLLGLCKWECCEKRAHIKYYVSIVAPPLCHLGENNTSGVLLISREERSTTVQHKIEERKDRYREEIENGIEKRV